MLYDLATIHVVASCDQNFTLQIPSTCAPRFAAGGSTGSLGGCRADRPLKWCAPRQRFASFIGSTGTPIESADVSTPAISGEYIDIYDRARAVEDGVTVPIYYESRLARLERDDDEEPRIEAEMIAAMLEDESLTEQEKQKTMWT